VRSASLALWTCKCSGKASSNETHMPIAGKHAEASRRRGPSLAIQPASPLAPATAHRASGWPSEVAGKKSRTLPCLGWMHRPRWSKQVAPPCTWKVARPMRWRRTPARVHFGCQAPPLFCNSRAPSNWALQHLQSTLTLTLAHSPPMLHQFKTMSATDVRHCSTQDASGPCPSLRLHPPAPPCSSTGAPWRGAGSRWRAPGARGTRPRG